MRHVCDSLTAVATLERGGGATPVAPRPRQRRRLSRAAARGRPALASRRARRVGGEEGTLPGRRSTCGRPTALVDGGLDAPRDRGHRRSAPRTSRRTPDQRAAWDVVTARAVGSLAEVVELALPLLRVGGRLVAWRRDTSRRWPASRAARRRLDHPRLRRRTTARRRRAARGPRRPPPGRDPQACARRPRSTRATRAGAVGAAERDRRRRRRVGAVARARAPRMDCYAPRRCAWPCSPTSIPTWPPSTPSSTPSARSTSSGCSATSSATGPIPTRSWPPARARRACGGRATTTRPSSDASTATSSTAWPARPSSGPRRPRRRRRAPGSKPSPSAASRATSRSCMAARASRCGSTSSRCPRRARSFGAFETPHCLVGHTHHQLVFRDDDGHIEAVSPSARHRASSSTGAAASSIPAASASHATATRAPAR